MPSSSDAIQRLAQNIRNIAQSANIQARNRQIDIEALEKMPDQMDEMSRNLAKLAAQLQIKAGTLRALLFKNIEDAEALLTLAHTAANVSTVLGSKGDNLEILTHTDPRYLKSVLTTDDKESMAKAIARLTPEQKQWYKDQLKLGD